jgi:hypothetical protein
LAVNEGTSLPSFSAVLVYRRAVGDGSDSSPLGEAVPHPDAMPASAFGLAGNEGTSLPSSSAVLVYRRAVGDGSDSSPLGEAVSHPGAMPASAFGLAVNAIPFN